MVVITPNRKAILNGLAFEIIILCPALCPKMINARKNIRKDEIVKRFICRSK
jgi:hypothetical protein